MGEFSFPAFQTDQQDPARSFPFPHFATSPLWFPACRRSFSSAEDAAKAAGSPNASALSDDEGASARAGGGSVSNEDKMDLLWEDLNDDLHRPPYEWKKKEPRAKSGSVGRAGCLLPHRKPSLVVMLEVLKKLFFVQRYGHKQRVERQQFAMLSSGCKEPTL